MEPVAEAVVTVGNSERFWRRVFHGFHQPGLPGPAFSSTRRETDCYSWHDSVVVALARMRPSRADPASPGFSVSRSDAPTKLRLVALCGGARLPGADGLLCGQRSYRTVRPNHKRPLLFQDGIHARRQLTGHCHNGFASGHFLGMPLKDAPVESPQFRIFANRYPSALNQLVAQTTVSGPSNRAAIYFLPGGVFAGH